MKKGIGWALQGKGLSGFGVNMDGVANREPTRLARRRRLRELKKLLAKSGK